MILASPQWNMIHSVMIKSIVNEMTLNKLPSVLIIIATLIETVDDVRH